MAQYQINLESLRTDNTTPPTGLQYGLIAGLPATRTHYFYPITDGIHFEQIGTASISYLSQFGVMMGMGSSVVTDSWDCLVKCLGINAGSPTDANDFGLTFHCRVADPANPGPSYWITQDDDLSNGNHSCFYYANNGGTVAASMLNQVNNRGAALHGTTPSWFRFNVTGQTFRVKSWLDGATEPTDWDQEWTDDPANGSSYGGTGEAYVGIMSSANGLEYEFYHLSFGTDGDSAPGPVAIDQATPFFPIAGTLFQPDNAPAINYTVRCYDRTTGAFLEETTTDASGNFAINLAQSGPVFVTAHDTNNVWNGLIKDLITPTANLVFETQGVGPNVIISNGKRTFTSETNASAVWHKAYCPGARAGNPDKVYFEVTVTEAGNDISVGLGFGTGDNPPTGFPAVTSASGGVDNPEDGNRVQYFNNGEKGFSGLRQSYGATYTDGDVIGVGLDQTTPFGTYRVTFYKNGVSQGEAYTVSSTDRYFVPHFCVLGSSNRTILELTAAQYLPSGYEEWR